MIGKTMADLNSLAIFAKVVGSNSFSKAARRLGLPVSTVSRRIAELEDQLRVRLLKRSTRSLRLTDIGSQVLEHAQPGVEVSDAVDHVVSYRLTRDSGTLRLGNLYWCVTLADSVHQNSRRLGPAASHG
jgi:DNA-binding transcriptional LysR family regulator